MNFEPDQDVRENNDRQHCETSASDELSLNNKRTMDSTYISLDKILPKQDDYKEVESKYEVKPSQLERYSSLGSGFFSVVYHGMLSQAIGKKPVAVKIPKDIASNPITLQNRDGREMLRSELMIMAHLQSLSGGHENVLQLVGAITKSKTDFCLLTEYCEWGSLDQFLRKKFENGDFENEIIFQDSDKASTTIKTVWKTQRDSSWEANFQWRRENGKLTTSDLLWFALQIARAMQFLNENKRSYQILHRDVAVRNVLLKSDFTLKVADFGLSRKLKAGDEAYQILNTNTALPTQYLAPESLTSGRFTMHSECWSFGIVVWELFTFALRPPYSAELEKHRASDSMVSSLHDYLASGYRLEIPSIAPNNLKDLVMKLWNEEPEQRPSFHSCRMLIRNKLMQSCEKILQLSEERTFSHASELYFNEKKACKISQEQPSLRQLADKVSQAQSSLRQLADIVRSFYKSEMKQYNPFSLPFTFDIESTWVSLTLKRNGEQSEDHIALIKTVFTPNNTQQMLYVEGNAATGKTSLLRRIAYDWANGRLLDFNLVLIAEFRHVRGSYKRITDLVIAGMAHFMPDVDINAESLSVFDSSKVLLLIDGYDESIENQCQELDKYLHESGPRFRLPHKYIVSSRPGRIKWHQKCRFELALLQGFLSNEQKERYVKAHFVACDNTNDEQINIVLSKLETNTSLNKIAETPLFLTFICLVHEKIVTGSLFDLYHNIIWWLLDRYQNDHRDIDVPELCGFVQKSIKGSKRRKMDKFDIIQNYFTDFPALRRIGKMCFKRYEANVFNDEDLDEYGVNDIIERVGILRKEIKVDESRRRTNEFVFPHRTIHEFLAGGVYYFWKENSSEYEDQELEKFNEKLTFNNKMLHDALIYGRPGYQERGLEKFVWMTGQIQNNKFFENSASFFARRKYIFVDMTTFFLQDNYQLSALYRCLNICTNLKYMLLYNFNGKCSIDFTNVEIMPMVESLDFRGRSTNRFSYFSEKELFLSRPVVTIPQANTIRDISFNGFHFLSSMSFVATMKHFKEYLRPTTTITLYHVAVTCSCFELLLNHVYINDSNSSKYKQQLSEYWIPEKNLNQAGCLQVSEISHVLILCGGVKYLCLEWETPATDIYSFIFPVLNSVLILELRGSELCGSDIFIQLLKQLPNLQTIIIWCSKIEISEWSSICMAIDRTKIRKIRLINITFDDEEDFYEFFDAMQNCRNIKKLLLDNGYNLFHDPPNTCWFDATQTFCDLAEKMSSLVLLDVAFHDDMEDTIFDSDAVQVAGLNRDCAFRCNVSWNIVD